ncbi:hypothetical protein BaRGS_00009101, partial [Batillaria attramentaria]
MTGLIATHSSPQACLERQETSTKVDAQDPGGRATWTCVEGEREARSRTSPGPPEGAE